MLPNYRGAALLGTEPLKQLLSCLLIKTPQALKALLFIPSNDLSIFIFKD